MNFVEEMGLDTAEAAEAFERAMKKIAPARKKPTQKPEDKNDG